MQLVARPLGFAACAQGEAFPEAIKEPVFELLALLIPLHKNLYGLGHEARHGLIALGGVDAEFSQKGLGKAERDVLVRSHAFKCIT
jgi:hypothetical protein